MLNLFQVEDNQNKKKRPRNNKSNTKKYNSSIDKTIQEWNSIKHIYRIKTLYKIYMKLFELTHENPLECLNYFADDGDYFAEIKDTGNKDLKERVLLHLDLLRKIKTNDNNLIHSEHIDLQTTDAQLSLFSLNS